MPRIIGVDIPNEKRVEIALTYLYGIGRTLANRILAEVGISPDKKAKDLTDSEVNAITHIIQERHKVEGDLRREESANVRRLISIGAYRGIRHKRNLPARGQRSKTNARTCKGPRKTIGAFKDKAQRKAVKPAA
ncbi:Ribosomal protein S13, bacterial-type [Candidatus Omnitrophus magneticus]|uniref:Small ribosomal subunit protein uS13 n=1 Tax=Candidatus Omnitrophus magneticus TaxID=1609969 RepID=A0A0F0CS60_9BACT|nr:Ribosomal protein S13, bacterial-type [Candidatus Omnitrophus magneticus]